MPRIHLTTFIQAPADRVFDLCRSIGLYKAFMRTVEKGEVEGGSDGFTQAGDKVSFSLKYLGRQRKLTSRISELKPNELFTSTLVSGSFRTMVHEHHFKAAQNGTILIDVLDYTLPFGIFGRLADTLFVHEWLRQYLDKRNHFIRQYAEGEKWKVIIPEKSLA